MTAVKHFASAALIVGLGLTTTFAPARAADTAPTLLGVSKDWTAYQVTTPSGKTCYALAKPKTSMPKKAKRDPIFFIISDWPDRKAKGEAQIVPGYQYKDASTVTAQVGTEKVPFFIRNFIRNDNGAGSAWVRDPADEAHLIDVMQHGAQLTVSGTSQRGTLTKDTYSLGGLGAALQKIDTACGM